MFLVFGFLLLIFCGVLLYSSTREHLLTALLSLEFMVLGIFFSLIFSLSNICLFYSLFYLIITACEGALGLSILVAMGRSHGGDYFKLLGLMS
uniref:NADH-ubiquinone oxidoreductase chain 4L n=1 Tax=Sinella curviseta TaxID=187695 RepID=A0A4P6D9Y6_9HEXA|nr:NADH dehydrogenase subunit 4L [Sinella curviseta]QAU56475.1 NADH dehydrogenase subunit 4L [Sinella curviseta]